MKGLIENEIIPKVVRDYQRPYIIHKTILTYGRGESAVAEQIEDWENNLHEFIKLAYLPAPGRVRLRLSARGMDKDLLEKAIEENVASLTEIIGDIIVGFEEDETLEATVGKVLTQQNKTIATAESCTGGSIAQLLSSVPGASNYFRGGVIAYATDVKQNVLNVSANLIQEHTVVSEEVVKAMALNVKSLLKTDYAIATTGNAGPSKGEADAEVGTVFIALATPNEVLVEKFDFGQPREKVIDRATFKGVEMLLKEISKKVL
jgi:nicotinamide-nucleotide amidase